MINLTEAAIEKVLDFAKLQDVPGILRIKVVGGGCGGFSYEMVLEDTKVETDKEFVVGAITVYVDPFSYQYLDGVEVDYTESLLGNGFVFNNPNVKSTCGCGSSFNA